MWTRTPTRIPIALTGEYSGDFKITSQSYVATLAGYTSISGYLSIECPSCTDLSDLICLTSVGGHLLIPGNDVLTNLNGLNALTLVGGNLGIGHNIALTNLDGLSGITSVGEWLGIDHNNALTNLEGLSGLTSVGEGLNVTWNATLTNLDGLSGITSVGENLGIYRNPALPDCEVCDLLDQITSGPFDINVHDNLDDTCTPVPANCP